MDHTQSAVRSSAVQPGESTFISEDGKSYRMPYRAVRRAVLSNLRRDELQDARHAARLQYSLMLLEPVIKATVDFGELKATVIYNPLDADNGMPKTDLGHIEDVLAQQGVHMHPGSVKDESYDYYGQLYSYAYSPRRTRESVPYGHSTKEWKGMERAYESKLAKADKRKLARFRAWQDRYLREHPAASSGRPRKRKSALLAIFGITR